ncbi:MAG: response regulator [Propionivibrio sp.]|nr:response regulator [Propionivibrio sp.]
MLRIMLVDDESNVTRALRRTLTRALQGESFAIETFDDPRLALERAGEVDFALVLSDYRMPPMDGVEFLKRFRIMQPDAVRLILSASSDVEALLAAINQAGAFRYILKPWDDTDLVYIVREALLAFKEQSANRRLADEACAREMEMSPEERERQRLEAEEPGITKVRWGSAGEVLLDDEDRDAPNS